MAASACSSLSMRPSIWTACSSAPTPSRSRVTLTVAFPDAASVELTATAPGVTLTRRYPVSSYPASDRPLSADSVTCGVSQRLSWTNAL